MEANKALKLVFLTLLFAGFITSHTHMSKGRIEQPAETKRAQALALDPTLLKIVSGPFKGLMADYLNLKASVFIGGIWDATPEDWEAVYILLKQSLYLDPFFFQTAYYTQGLLSWRENYHRKAIDLLEIHAKQRFWDWEPKFYLGFDYFRYLKDNETASHYMQEASKLPGAPTITATLAARLTQQSGQTLTAIAFLQSMLERTEDEFTQDMLTKRLSFHLGLYQLEKARDVYVSQIGHLPDTLNELFEEGFVRDFPSDLSLDAFLYDSKSGEIALK